ncbi:hypothetical protein U9M48_006987, partial [Paspalum notatum var. saurae]
CVGAEKEQGSEKRGAEATAALRRRNLNLGSRRGEVRVVLISICDKSTPSRPLLGEEKRSQRACTPLPQHLSLVDCTGGTGCKAHPPATLPALVHDLGTQQQVESQTLYSITRQALFTHTIDKTPQGWVLATGQSFPPDVPMVSPRQQQKDQLPPVQVDFPDRCKCLLSDVPSL